MEKDGLSPLHVRVSLALKDEILNGVYAGKIPGEFELMEKFSVSRSTIRQAIDNLVREGVLEKKHGIGTFVASRPVEEWLGSLSSFFDIVKGMGMEPSIKVLEQGFSDSPKEVSEIMGVNRFFYIHRLRLADNIPLVMEKQYYPRIIGKALSKLDLNNVSTYDVLESKLGEVLSEAQQLVTCTIPTEEEKTLLKLDPKCCCAILSERFVNNADGDLVEYERSVYRADMYAFRINLTRKRAL
jgi:GntR family transcriptional regulator